MGRPKGSKNKPKRGRPKGKQKKVVQKEEIFVQPLTLEEKEDRALTAALDDSKFVETGYNLSTDSIINSEPINDSYYYRGSKNVPVAGAQYEFTAAMVNELRKCKEDIIYFAENFFYIVATDREKKKLNSMKLRNEYFVRL